MALWEIITIWMCRLNNLWPFKDSPVPFGTESKLLNVTGIGGPLRNLAPTPFLQPSLPGSPFKHCALGYTTLLSVPKTHHVLCLGALLLPVPCARNSFFPFLPGKPESLRIPLECCPLCRSFSDDLGNGCSLSFSVPRMISTHFSYNAQ